MRVKLYCQAATTACQYNRFVILLLLPLLQRRRQRWRRPSGYAHSDKSHHLDVSRNAGRAGESEHLRAYVPSSRSDRKKLGRRYVIRMKSTSRTTARSDREILHIVLVRPLLIGAGNEMLEACIGLVELPVMETSTFSSFMITTPSSTSLAP